MNSQAIFRMRLISLSIFKCRLILAFHRIVKADFKTSINIEYNVAKVKLINSSEKANSYLWSLILADTENSTVSYNQNGTYEILKEHSLYNSAVANLIGSGSIQMKITKILKATISGSGNIYYKGSPQITKVISGTGQLINAN